MMMISSGLIAGLMCLGLVLVVGAVLLAVGLARRTPAMWISGIAVLAVALVLLGPLAGMAVWIGLSRGTMPPWPQRARWAAGTSSRTTTTTDPDDLAGWLREVARLELPAGVRPAAGRRKTVTSRTSTTTLHIRLTGGDALQAFLDDGFQKAAWDDVRDTLISPDAASVPGWRLGGAEAMACYRLTRAPPGAGSAAVELHAAFDAPAGQAYLVAVRRDED